MIQPSRHAKSADNPAQVLVVAPVSGDRPWLEGTAPLFSGFIGLTDDPADERNSFRVYIKSGHSDWIKLPEMVGKDDKALLNMPEGQGPLTDISIRFPQLTSQWVQAQAENSSARYFESARIQATKNGALVADGLINVGFGSDLPNQVQYIDLYIDGAFCGVSNARPYTMSINTRTLTEGEHVAEIDAIDGVGTTVKSSRSIFFIQRSESRASNVFVDR
jgi:hypothetical protein